MTQPMTPTDTVVSEATDTKHVKAMIEAVGHAGRVGVYHATDASGDLTIHGPKAKALLTELLDRRTATPQSGGVVVKGLEWREITSPREDGPAEPTGDVEANTMIGEYSVCFDPDEDVADSPWCAWAAPDECIGHFADPAEARAAAQTDFEARIRSTLADPIPEAPADEEVEGVMRVLTECLSGFDAEVAEALGSGGERADLWTDIDVPVAALRTLLALRRSTETDKPGVREAIDPRVVIDDDGGPWLPDDTGHPRHAGDKRGEIELFIRDAYASGCRAGQNRSLTTAVEYANRHAPELIRRLTLSASPLTEEQPTHRHKKRGTEYVLIGIGKMQAELWVDASKLTELPGPAGRVDMREVAIYRSATDPTEIWARPREEFEDGRFEPLPRSTTGGAK